MSYQKPLVVRSRRLVDLGPRRTMIPILLTLGFFMIGSGAAQWMVDADHPFSAQNLRWTAELLPIMGLAMLGLAVMNMIFVRKNLGAGA